MGRSERYRDISSLSLLKSFEQQSYLATATAAASAAACLLHDKFMGAAGIRSDLGKDIKTEADLAAERALLDRLETTGIPVLSEEGGGNVLTDVGMGRHWIIDPLDGTLNFVRGFPVSCVSVALLDGGHPELGVVAECHRRRIYRGETGGGAHVDNMAIRVSEVSETAQAVLATGFPTGRSFEDGRLSAFVSAVKAFKKVRLIGSAALSLAYVAEGVFDAYCEEDIWLWDVAAGLALVHAAGGTYWMTPPKVSGQVTVFASNGRIKPPDTLISAYENLEKYTHA